MTGLAAMAVNPGIRTHAGQGAQADFGIFDIRLIDVDGQRLLVGHRPGDRKRPPLLMFNGIGGNIELLAPLAEARTLPSGVWFVTVAAIVLGGRFAKVFWMTSGVTEGGSKFTTRS